MSHLTPHAPAPFYSKSHKQHRQNIGHRAHMANSVNRYIQKKKTTAYYSKHYYIAFKQHAVNRTSCHSPFQWISKHGFML